MEVSTPVENATHVLVPVGAIRFTHDVIDGHVTPMKVLTLIERELVRAIFRPSIYRTLDELLSGDIGEL